MVPNYDFDFLLRVILLSCYVPIGLSIYHFSTVVGAATYIFSVYRAVYIRRKCGNKQLSSSIYLSEAEPFLEQFAKLSPQNQALIGSAGSLVRTEDFLAIAEEGQDEEGDLVAERDMAPSGPTISVKDTVPKSEGLIVFFPGNSFTVLVGFPYN